MVRLLYRRSSADAGVFAVVERGKSTFGPRYGGLTTQNSALWFGMQIISSQNFFAAFTESAGH